MDIVLALLALAAGFALMLAGYRLARIMIPMWGFITGVVFGASIAADLSSTPLLGITLGLLTGIITGVVLAALSYLFFSAAVIILCGAVGYWLGSNFIFLITGNLSLLAALIGIGLGIVGGAVALAFDTPKYVLITLTALAGSLTTITGILLLTNQVQSDTLSYGTVQAAIDNSALWVFAAFCLATAGVIMQTITTSQYFLKEWAVSPKPTQHHSPPSTNAL